MNAELTEKCGKVRTSYVVAASELKANSYTVKRPKTYAYNDQVDTYMLYSCSYIPVTWQFLTREWLQHAGINRSHDVSMDGYQLECNITTTAKCFKPAHIFNSPNFHKVFLSNHKNMIHHSAHQQICRGISLSACRLTYNDSMYHYTVIKYKNTQKIKLKFTFSVISESELEDAKKSQ